MQAVQDIHLSPFVLGTVDGHLEQATVQLHSSRSVIIPRHRVRHQAGVAVRVHHTHSGNVHLCCISDSYVLLEHIVESGKEDDEVWQADSWAVLDGGVGKKAALPVARMGVLPTILSGGLQQVAKLTPAADKQYDATTIRYMGSEVQGLLEVLHSLVKINYVVVQTAAIEVRLHKPEKKRELERLNSLHIQSQQPTVFQFLAL